MRGDTRALIDTGAPLGSVRTGVLQGCSTAFRNARTSPRPGSSQLAFFRAGLPPSATPVAPGGPNVPIALRSGQVTRGVTAVGARSRRQPTPGSAYRTRPADAVRGETIAQLHLS